MTPEQYEILQEVNERTIRIEERYNTVEKEQKKHSQSVVDIVKMHVALEKRVDADRNKFLGAIALASLGFITMVIGFIVSLFKN